VPTTCVSCAPAVQGTTPRMARQWLGVMLGGRAGVGSNDEARMGSRLSWAFNFKGCVNWQGLSWRTLAAGHGVATQQQVSAPVGHPAPEPSLADWSVGARVPGTMTGWKARMECQDGVQGWSARHNDRMECQDGVLGWSARMESKDGVPGTMTGWRARMECQDGAPGWSDRMECQNVPGTALGPPPRTWSRWGMAAPSRPRTSARAAAQR